MSKVWREIADPSKHSDFMSNEVEGGIPVETRRDNLLEKWVYMAEIGGFTLQFVGIDQARECVEYFERKVHPSTRRDHPPYEHYWHSWYCKLPKGFTKDSKRQKVLNTLNKILEKWG